MRALTMDEVGFVSGGQNQKPVDVVTVEGVRLPPRGNGFGQNVGGGGGAIGGFIDKQIKDFYATQNKALELFNDPSIDKEEPYTLDGDTITEMTDQYGNRYQVTDRDSDGWNDRVRMRTPAGALFQWGPAVGGGYTWLKV